MRVYFRGFHISHINFFGGFFKTEAYAFIMLSEQEKPIFCRDLHYSAVIPKSCTRSVTTSACTPPMCDSAVPYLRYQAITLKNMNGVVYCMLADHE